MGVPSRRHSGGESSSKFYLFYYVYCAYTPHKPLLLKMGPAVYFAFPIILNFKS
jgi:hypothetical protein